MRMLLKAVLNTEATSEDIRSGAGGEAIDRLQEALQPEALYFFGEDGTAHGPCCLRLGGPVANTDDY